MAFIIKARFLVLFAGWLILILAASVLFAQTSQSDRQLTQGQQTVSSQKRLALVIGNGAYVSAPPLKNPPNDARDMAATLNSLGFEVSSGINVGQREMKRLIREFGQKLKGGGSGLFYYAGHGVQSKGHNYLIPVDAEIQSEAEVEDSGVDAALVLNYMDDAQNGLNIVILDACRNNPFARSFRSASDGLAQVDAPTGTLIAYATAPGHIASDGQGQNGLYTSELLKQMRVPNVSVTDMFMRVRAEVMKQTGNKQVPWESSSLVGTFYFGGGGSASNPGSTERTSLPPAVNPTVIELNFWDSIKNSTNPEDFNAYLRKYPNGEFADLARIRVANLSRDSTSKPSSAKGDLGGIAVQFEMRDNHPVIKSVVPNGPGDRAGLKAGDQILKVDGQDLNNVPQERIAAMIRGPVGTQVTLTIRTGESSPRDLLLTRAWSAGLAAAQYFEAGVEAEKKNLWAEAEVQYREAVKLDNDNAWYHSALGYALNRQNKNVEAEAEYRKAVILDPKTARYHTLLAWVVYNRIDPNGDVQNYGEALAEARAAVQLDPKEGWNHNMLGLVLLAQKKWSEAEAEFTEAVRLEPATSAYKDNLQKAKSHKRF